MLKNPRVAAAPILLLVVLFSASAARATINQDAVAACATSTTGTAGSNCSPSSGGTSTTLSWSHTIGTGSARILLVGVSMRVDNGGLGAGTFVSGITLGGAALTCVVAINDNAAGSCGTGTSGTVFLRSEIWSLKEPASGTATITVTTNSATTMAAGSASFFGALSVASGGTSASNNGVTGGTSATKAVTSPFGSLVFGNVALAKLSAGNQITVTSGNTNLTDQSDNASAGSHVQGDASDSTAVNPTMSWTFNHTSPWAVTTAVVTPARGRRAQVTSGAALHDERPFDPIVPAGQFAALE